MGSGGHVSCSPAIPPESWRFKNQMIFPFRKFREPQPLGTFFVGVGKMESTSPKKATWKKTVIQQFGVFTADMCPLIDRHFKIQLKLKMVLVWGKNVGKWLSSSREYSKHLVTSSMFALVFVHCQGVKGINAFRCRNSSNDSLRRIFWVGGCVFCSSKCRD